jgi:hypothetical protein
MSQDRGWGSRPLDGRDWGASASCSNSVLRELMLRFEHALEMEGTTFAKKWDDDDDLIFYSILTIFFYSSIKSI